MEEKPEITRNKQEIRDDKGRFIEGFSGNPNGRPKGALSFATKWERMVEKIAMQNNMTPEEIDEQLLLVGYKRAKEGDYSFYRDAMDRIHGKPVQPTDITSGGKPIIQIAPEIAEKNDLNSSTEGNS